MKRIYLFLVCSLAAALLIPGQSFSQVTLNPVPSRVIGHPRRTLTTDQPNLVEGRELNNPQSVAIDTVSSPPALYVADTGNNRVLGWRNASSFSNGAAADLVIGQRDRFSTLPLGPGTAQPSGLNQPTAVAIDRAGNLYVIDSANHRVLRYPRPFEQQGEFRIADLVLGQPNLNSRTANAGGLSARSLLLSSSTGVFRASLAFDSQGNLYVTDPGNHRVLRYGAGSLDAGTPGPDAELVLGQPDFQTNTAASLNQAGLLNKSGMRNPSGLALDSQERLFVTDAVNRVLVFNRPASSGVPAARILGIANRRLQDGALVPINPTNPPAVNDSAFLVPEGVFAIGDIPFVVDTGNARILRFDPFDRWPPEESTFSPAARAVFGQESFNTNRGNRGRPEPAGDSLFLPVRGAFAAGETFIVDSGNHRLLVFPNLSTGTAFEARRLLGQVSAQFRAPNLIEGRELFGPSAVAVDRNSNPPRLYIADTLNNRILGFADARKVKPGDRADIVIGQPDFFRSIVNFPGNDRDVVNDSGLLTPAGVAVDSEGRLWVADTGNRRVLRFSNPFGGQPAPLRADLVIGQSSFTAKASDATERTMSAPYGLAFTSDGHLLVSDLAHNRVLLFLRPFSNGMQAFKVFGQANFVTAVVGTEENRMNGPRQIATDSDDRLYVADTGNNRVLIFNRVTTAETDPRSAITLPRLGAPQGIAVSAVTGEIWVADTRGNRALRFPRFDRLPLSTNFETSIPYQAPPVAVALDSFGNLLVADSANRVVVHFPGFSAVNAGNFLPRVAPGLITSLFAVRDNGFGEQTKTFSELAEPVPLPTTLADIQVLVEDQPARLYFVSPRQINFLMPMNAPSSGTANVEVVDAAVGQIFASSQIRMEPASPALFTSNASGTGQVAALNQDGTVNSPTNPIGRGQVIQLFGTGQGFVPGAPPDGSLVEGVVPTDVKPRVLVNTDFLSDEEIQYSGLAPGLVGVWQINIKIPDRVPPSNSVLVIVVMNSIPSNNPQNPQQIRTTISVKQ